MKDVIHTSYPLSKVDGKEEKYADFRYHHSQIDNILHFDISVM